MFRRLRYSIVWKSGVTWRCLYGSLLRKQVKRLCETMERGSECWSNTPMEDIEDRFLRSVLIDRFFCYILLLCHVWIRLIPSPWLSSCLSGISSKSVCKSLDLRVQKTSWVFVDLDKRKYRDGWVPILMVYEEKQLSFSQMGFSTIVLSEPCS